jgi:membrane associated rhomboid family serine protease
VDETDPATETGAPACYLHPKRPALLRCSRCEQPICSDDAIEAPVGYQCPKCAEGGQPVQRMIEVMTHAPTTRALVIAIGVLFAVEFALPIDLVNSFGLRPILVAVSGVELFDQVAAFYTPTALARVIGEPWLIITSGFLHANLMHVAFNGLLLWQLGHMLEPVLGRARFIVLYAAGLLGGALGVVGLSWIATWLEIDPSGLLGGIIGGNPFAPTIGASGAVFGLMGAALVMMRERGINPWQTGLGGLVLLNLGITFLPGISVGGHLGGLAAGALAARLLLVEREQVPRAVKTTGALVVGMAVLTYALAAGLAGLLLT